MPWLVAGAVVAAGWLLARPPTPRPAGGSSAQVCCKGLQKALSAFDFVMPLQRETAAHSSISSSVTSCCQQRSHCQSSQQICCHSVSMAGAVCTYRTLLESACAGVVDSSAGGLAPQQHEAHQQQSHSCSKSALQRDPSLQSWSKQQAPASRGEAPAGGHRFSPAEPAAAAGRGPTGHHLDDQGKAVSMQVRCCYHCPTGLRATNASGCVGQPPEGGGGVQVELAPCRQYWQNVFASCVVELSLGMR